MSAALSSCTIQVYFAERSLSTNITVPLNMTVEQIRQEILQGIQNYIAEKWPGLLSPVEMDASKVVIVSDDKGIVGTDRNTSNLTQLGFRFNSVIRAVVGARFDYPQAQLDPYIVQEPIYDQFHTLLDRRLRDEKNVYDAMIAKKEQELKNTKNTLSGTQKSNQKLRAENDKLKQLPADKPAWFAEYEARMEKQEKEIGSLQIQVKETTVKIVSLENANEALQKANNALKNEVNILQTENRALKKEVEDLLDDQQDWNIVGTLKDLQSSLGLRQLLIEAQSYLAKAAKLSDPTVYEWRKLLMDKDDEERLKYVQSLLANCNDPVVQNILQSPEALRLVTERKSDARKKGNKMAHRKPKRKELLPAVEKETKAGKLGYHALLNVLPS